MYIYKTLWHGPRSIAIARRIRSAILGTGILALAPWVAAPGPARASQDLSMLCEQAAGEASRQTGVPLSVLRAISLAETGRKRAGGFRPWPWTVNMEGQGHWFDTEDEARAYVFREFRRGARSFDVGCFQINYKWHGSAFASIEQMFDPVQNARYAADFLSRLYAEHGSWGAAAGAYHSLTPEFADRYRLRFESIHARLDAGTAGAPQSPAPQDIPEIPDIVAAAGQDGSGGTAVARVNRFPLLMAGSPAGLGSLFPASGAGLGSLLATPATGSD